MMRRRGSVLRSMLILGGVLAALVFGGPLLLGGIFRYSLHRADDVTTSPADYPARLAIWKASVPDAVRHFPAVIPRGVSDARFRANYGPLQASANLVLSFTAQPAETAREIQRVRAFAIPAPSVAWLSKEGTLDAMGFPSPFPLLTQNAVGFYVADNGRGVQGYFFADPTTGFVCYSAIIE